jgi:hypothetical protein
MPWKPGLAFSTICDRGYAIGLYTHKHESGGELVWIADGFWDEEPTLADVAAVERWRWCTFFLLHSALHRRAVYPIGKVAIPDELKKFPLLREGAKGEPWYRSGDGTFRFPAERTDDRSLNLARIIDEVTLRRRLESEWRPEEEW